MLSSGFLALNVSSILIRYLFKDYDIFVTTTYSVVYAAILSSVIFLCSSQVFFIHFSAAAFYSLIGAGVISTGLGYFLFFLLSQCAGTVFVSLFGYLVPIFGFLLSSIFLKENILWTQAFGGIVILLGVMLINKRMDQST